jgi:hypothetical protein
MSVMRIIGAIAGVVLVGFLAVLGFFWLRDGSLERAGHDMDKSIESVDQSTKPLQHEMKNVGEATKESVQRATGSPDTHS